jgi:hypothetical protein
MKPIILFKRSVILLFVLLTFQMTIHAQQSNSLYFLEQTPIQSQWNPALTPGRTYVGAGISNFGISVRSDLAYSDIFIPNSTTGKLDWFLNSSVDKEAWIGGLKSISNFGMSAQNDLLNLGFKIGDNFVSLHAGIYADANIGVPKDFFTFFMLGMDEEASSTAYNLKDLSFNAFTYSKVGVGLSRKFDKLSVGVNLNYLIGMTNLQMGFDRFDVDAAETGWDIKTNGYLNLTGPDAIQLKYDDEGIFSGIENESSGMEKAFLPSSSPGKGFSVDLGASYKPLDFLTVSASLVDLGSIKWKTDAISRAESNGTFHWDGSDLEEDGDNDPLTDLKDMVNFKKVDNVSAYKTKLTTKLNLSAEASILNDQVTFGILSQSRLAEDDKSQNFMFAANYKPGKIFQGSLTYSTLNGSMSSIGAGMNLKLLFFNFFIAADYIPLKVTAQYLPLNNSNFNLQTGFNLMF